MIPEILNREILHQGYLRVERLRVRLASGAVVVREVERHGDAVAVLPFDQTAGIALIVRLFRVTAFDRLGLTTLDEACAGMIDAGETAEAAVRREAMEELGVRLRTLDHIGRVWPSPGVIDEQVDLFLAPYEGADRVAQGGGLACENEDITVIARPLTDLAADADAGAIIDMKLLTLVQTLRIKRPDLFSA